MPVSTSGDEGTSPADSKRGPYRLNSILPFLRRRQRTALSALDDLRDAMHEAYIDDGAITANELPGILLHLENARAAGGDALNITNLLDERKLDVAQAEVDYLEERERTCPRRR